MQLKVKFLSPKAAVPNYAHSTDSGMDLAAIDEVIIRPQSWKVVNTGIAIQLPPNTEMQIRSRSGLARKNGIFVLNSPATIDEGYTGEIAVILANFSNAVFVVEPGMRIAQAVIAPVLRPEIVFVDELAATDRGSNGFGSTGV